MSGRKLPEPKNGPVIPIDINFWTASEAQKICCVEHVSLATVRRLIKKAGLEPKGSRHSAGHLGRKSTVYDSSELIELLSTLL
jgi:hypothetical protein